MLDLGTQELIVIFIVAFLVFGPKKMPELARTLGKGMRQLKSAMHGITESLEEAESDIKEEMKGATGLEESIYESISSNINDITKTVEDKKEDNKAESKKEKDDDMPRLFGDSEDTEQQQKDDTAVTTEEEKKEPGTDG
ncbi:MAG: twin-arginine translocase TatA/TatE family subunit [Nitrospira sp.]|nr:twin-arginine translocase TatA/TatE family subunit [Nitrospira sp.]